MQPDLTWNVVKNRNRDLIEYTLVHAELRLGLTSRKNVNDPRNHTN